MSLHVRLVKPEGELWSGAARHVIAKTLDGDIGILTGHTPVLGILAEGSVVQIRSDEASEPDVLAAVASGYLSVADDEVSVLARDAILSTDVDKAMVRAELEAALGDADPVPSHEEPGEIRYLRAQLRVAGEPG